MADGISITAMGLNNGEAIVSLLTGLMTSQGYEFSINPLNQTFPADAPSAWRSGVSSPARIQTNHFSCLKPKINSLFMKPTFNPSVQHFIKTDQLI